MADDWDLGGRRGGGGDGRSGRDINVCVRVREKKKERVYWRGRWMKARFGDRGLKNAGTPNPPSTEILALNPSYGIVCCRRDFFLSFFLWPSFFLMDSLAPSTPPSLHSSGGFFS